MDRFRIKHCFTQRPIDFTTELKEDQIQSILANLRQVSFEVTDACNLKCKYCCYGDLYGHYSERMMSMMKPSIGRRLIDYLIPYWNSCQCTSHKAVINIGFYGGEPLINDQFIHDIVAYTQSCYLPHHYFRYSMTTNGILLDQQIDFLVEHDFHVLISLDGDRRGNGYRIDHQGQIGYERIVANVDRIRQKYPEFYEKNVNFSAVLHDLNSLEAVYSFFRDRFGKSPSIGELNPLGVKPDKKRHFEKMYKSCVPQEPCSSDGKEMIREMQSRLPQIRRVYQFIERHSGYYYPTYNDLLVGDEPLHAYPSGTCVPFGKRMFVTVDGKLLPCEKIGHHHVLGEVDEYRVSLDFKAIAAKYEAFYRKLSNQCRDCALPFTCTHCFLNSMDMEPKKCPNFQPRRFFNEYASEQMAFLVEFPEFYQVIMEEMVTDG